MTSFLIFLTIFTLLIGFHEFGHFIIARAFNVKVRRFALGFGKPLIRWQFPGGTEWVVGIFPLGGYVRFMDEREGEVAEKDVPNAFNRQPIFVRFLILLAGPFCNFLLAFILYWFVLSLGLSQLHPVIQASLPQSIAANAGLNGNEQILSLNDKAIANWETLIWGLVSVYGSEKSVTLQSKDLATQQIANHRLDLTHWHWDNLRPNPLLSLGIQPLRDKTLQKHFIFVEKYPFYWAWLLAGEKTAEVVQVNLMLIKKLILGQISIKTLGGPLSILQGASVASRHGITNLLLFMMFLSVSLGVLNLLPIPVLDGGQILLLGIEKIRGQPLSLRTQVLLFQLGLILLFLLIMHGLANDLERLGS